MRVFPHRRLTVFSFFFLEMLTRNDSVASVRPGLSSKCLSKHSPLKSERTPGKKFCSFCLWSSFVSSFSWNHPTLPPNPPSLVQMAYICGSKILTEIKLTESWDFFLFLVPRLDLFSISKGVKRKVWNLFIGLQRQAPKTFHSPWKFARNRLK